MVRVDRFRDVVVHAGGETVQAVFIEGIRRHGEDRCRCVSGQGADPAGGFEAVQHRHLDVHQDQRVAAVLCHGHGSRPICGQIDVETGVFEQTARNLLIDWFVFGEQDARTAMALLQQ